MKQLNNPNKWLKFGLVFSLVLNMLLISEVPTTMAFENQYFRYSDNYLYQRYLHFKGTDPVYAIMFLWAYRFRETPAFVDNIEGYADELNEEVRNLKNEIDRHKDNIETVNKHIRHCGCYSCDKCELKNNSASAITFGLSGTRNSTALKPPPEPPDSAVVCTGSNYRGTCQVLSVGEYDNATQIGLPNNSISSIRLGSNVMVILYSNAYQTGGKTYILSDYPLLFGFDNHTTSLEVKLK